MSERTTFVVAGLVSLVGAYFETGAIQVTLGVVGCILIAIPQFQRFYKKSVDNEYRKRLQRSATAVRDGCIEERKMVEQLIARLEENGRDNGQRFAKGKRTLGKASALITSYKGSESDPARDDLTDKQYVEARQRYAHILDLLNEAYADVAASES